jgi:aspartate aminotransferase
MDHTKLARRMSTVSESTTLALNARAKQLSAEGRTIYNLTAGELASDTPKYIQNAVSKTLHLNKYTPVAGLVELRSAIAKEANAFYGQDSVETDNVVVTGGAKPALYASLLAIIDPGDEVIVPTPAWVSYRHLIELVGGVVVEVPLTDSLDIDSDKILARVSGKTKAIIINSPQNPTGAIFSNRSLSSLANGMRNSGVVVISDDIYSKLVYVRNFKPVPTYDFEKVIIINGFSKSQALTGWRIGYTISDKTTAKAITSLLSHITGNAAVPSQHAALAAMTRFDKPPASTITMLKRNRKIVDELLSSIPKIKYVIPGGAFYFFIDIREITVNSSQWCENLLISTGVALVPGEAFSAPGFVRLSFVADNNTLVKSLELIRNFINKGS